MCYMRFYMSLHVSMVVGVDLTFDVSALEAFVSLMSCVTITSTFAIYIIILSCFRAWLGA